MFSISLYRHIMLIPGPSEGIRMSMSINKGLENQSAISPGGFCTNS